MHFTLKRHGFTTRLCLRLDYEITQLGFNVFPKLQIHTLLDPKRFYLISLFQFSDV